MRSLLRGLACLLVLGAMAATASAQYYWTPGTTDFNNPANWTPNGVPGASDSVYVNDAATPATIQAASDTVTQLFIGVNGASGTLSLGTGAVFSTASPDTVTPNYIGQIFIGGGSADGLTPGHGELDQSGDSVANFNGGLRAGIAGTAVVNMSGSAKTNFAMWYVIGDDQANDGNGQARKASGVVVDAVLHDDLLLASTQGMPKGSISAPHAV